MQDFPYSRHSSYDELCDLVKAFLPTDVYPCTVDEENWGPEVSVEHLFGRFCSGTTFAHDCKMKMLPKRQLTSKSELDGDDDDESQSLKSSREGSLESPLSQNADEPDQQGKRRRLSPPLSSNYHGSVDVSRERLHKVKKSFQEHLRRKQSNTNVSARLEAEAESIELSNASSSNSDDDAGDFLLGEVPEPNSISSTTPASQSGPETQLSISDAAFESQSPHYSRGITGADRVQRRKEAYKAAKNLSGVWETDHALVSSFDGHGEEELEL